MSDNDTTGRRNAAIEAGRLFESDVDEGERCHGCGELLHPYPAPKYWMQYPLPTCCVLDGLKFCDNSRKPACIDTHLAELPNGLDDLLAAAMAAVVEIDAAVMCGDGAAAELAGARYEATIWMLNGGANFGCMADENAAGCVIERHCAAIPGQVPLWGQRGEFMAVAGGVRALVEYEPGHGGPLTAHFQFHAIDLDRPFVSATGYRSHFDTAHGGLPVDAVARGILAAMLAEEKRPVMIEAGYRDLLAEDSLPAWLAGLEPPARRESATIPPGHVLVDVVLPAHKAFIVRRWSAEAAAKVKAARAARSNTKGKIDGTDSERDPVAP